jgi:hypothetical protein
MEVPGADRGRSQGRTEVAARGGQRSQPGADRGRSQGRTEVAARGGQRSQQGADRGRSQRWTEVAARGGQRSQPAVATAPTVSGVPTTDPTPSDLARASSGLCHFHWVYAEKAGKCIAP